MNLVSMKSGERAGIKTLPSGKEIEKISCMPFGGPVTVMLEGRHFAVSHSIAEHIEIESAGSRQIRGEREK